jgi:ABC-type phosphate transport system substrate-binding protein
MIRKSFPPLSASRLQTVQSSRCRRVITAGYRALLLLPLFLFGVYRTHSALANVSASPVRQGPYSSTTPNLWNQPSGTGGNVHQMMRGTVDFAVTNRPLSDSEMKDGQGTILHFPTILNADVLIYNLPHVPRGRRLRLTGSVIADI